MRACADVGSFIESQTSVVQTSSVGFTSEVSDYLVVHTGAGLVLNHDHLDHSSPMPGCLKLDKHEVGVSKILADYQVESVESRESTT